MRQSRQQSGGVSAALMSARGNGGQSRSKPTQLPRKPGYMQTTRAVR